MRVLSQNLSTVLTKTQTNKTKTRKNIADFPSHSSFRLTNLGVKVISRLLWFCITTLSDWLTRATFSTNGNPNQIQSCFGRTCFPVLGTSYMYLLRILIGSSCCLHLLWLARVITFVLVLRHSIGNRSSTWFLLAMSLLEQAYRSQE